MAPRLSVVVPTFDRPAAITALLGELDRQTLDPGSFEVVVVDDGSATDLGALIDPEEHAYGLHLERQPNAGPAAARQRGAERATGELLVFVDDDLAVPPHFLASHRAHHDGGDRLVVLGCVHPHEETAASLVERYRVRDTARLIADITSGRKRLAGEHLYTGNVSLPRALFEEVGGFDVGLRQLEDVDLGIRLEQAGARFELSHDAWVRHRRDRLTVAEWFDRSLQDGAHWAQLARKHPGEPTASPWHFVELMNPVSRPLVTLSALAPAPAAGLAGTAFRAASRADALGWERVALAGATFVYAVQMFRGVGVAAGDRRAALAEWRRFRRGVRSTGRSGAKPLRELVAAIAADHRALIDNNDRYDERHRTIGSPAVAFVTNIGFQLVVAIRVMQYLRTLRLPLAARIAARVIRHTYGSEIHWDADLAPGLVVIHGYGLTISYAARTAPGTSLSQNVTLGIGRDPSSGEIGAPALEAGVSVGPGATLIGPIVIGAGAKIMPGCTVTQSVPPRSIVDAPPISVRPRD